MVSKEGIEDSECKVESKDNLTNEARVVWLEECEDNSVGLRTWFG
jgi:hypothetical protein